MHIAFFDQANRAQPASDALARDRLQTALRARGHDVTMVSGVPLLEHRPAGRGLSRPDAWEGMRRLCAVDAEAPIDALYVTSCDGRGVASLFCSRYPRKPVLLAFRGPTVEPNLSLSFSRWRWTDSRIVIIVPSYELRKRLESQGAPHRIVVIPNGVERPLSRRRTAADVRAALGLRCADNLWVIAGTIRREQKLIEFLSQLESLPQYAPRLLVIVGAALDCDRQQRLAAAVSRSSLRERIALLGAHPPESLLDYIAAADLCLFLPDEEGGRSTLLQAALLGTSVIAGSSPSHARLVELPWVTLVDTSIALPSFIERAAYQSAQRQHKESAAAPLFTVAEEADALLALCKAEECAPCGPRLPVLSALPGALLPEKSDAPILVIARGCGNLDEDRRWGMVCCARIGAHGSAARIVLGTTPKEESSLLSLLSQESALLCVPDIWLESACPEAVVLVESCLRQQPYRAVLGFGLRSAGLLAALTGRSMGIPSIVVLDDLDAANLRAETAPADTLALGMACIILAHSPLPCELSGFSRKEDDGLSVFVAQGAGSSLQLSSGLLRQLAMPPRCREELPCTFT